MEVFDTFAGPTQIYRISKLDLNSLEEMNSDLYFDVDPWLFQSTASSHVKSARSRSRRPA